MRVRGARKSDFNKISELATAQGIVINAGHLKSLVIVEEEDDIIAFLSIETILEASITTNESFSRKDRVRALKLLMKQGWLETKRLGHDKILAYTTNNMINRVLQRKFNFEPAKGEPLIGRVDRYPNG